MTLISRLNIIDKIDSTTPICVLTEMLKCHDIDLDPTKVNPYSIKQYLLNKPIGHFISFSESIHYIAKYVNPNVSWNRQDLFQAWTFLKKWENPNEFQAPNYFTFGQQTPQLIDSLNATVLYKICVHNNIKLHSHTGLSTMVEICYMLNKPDSYIKSMLYNRIALQIDRLGMLNIYSFFDNVLQENLTTNSTDVNSGTLFDELVKCHDNLNNARLLLDRIYPRTNAEAIAMAALKWDIDISDAFNPLKEFEFVGNDYRPVDLKQIEKYSQNPNSIYLTLHFNPQIPEKFYKRNVLYKLAIMEGYTDEEIREETAYSLLQLSTITNTFYHGIFYEKETEFLKLDCNDLEYKNCFVSFGNM